MSNQELDQIADQLRQSDEYRVIHRYQKPEGYNVASPNDKKLIGVFLDKDGTKTSNRKKMLSNWANPKNIIERLGLL